MPRKRADDRQIAFDFDPPRSAEELSDTLVTGGFASNGSMLMDLDQGTLRDPDAPYLPRSVSFPVTLNERAPGGPRLELSTPAAGSLPFVRRVEEATGLKAAWYPDPGGGSLAQWWHAADLCDDKRWRDLLASREHTTDHLIGNAVQFRIETGKLSIMNARAVLAALRYDEPADRSDTVLFGRNGLQPCRTIGATNLEASGPLGGWAMIHAIEDGWVALVRGHAKVTVAYWRRVNGADAPLPVAAAEEAKKLARKPKAAA